MQHHPFSPYANPDRNKGCVRCPHPESHPIHNITSYKQELIDMVRRIKSERNSRSTDKFNLAVIQTIIEGMSEDDIERWRRICQEILTQTA